MEKILQNGDLSESEMSKLADLVKKSIEAVEEKVNKEIGDFK